MRLDRAVDLAAAASLLTLAVSPDSALDIEAKTEHARKVLFGKLLSRLRDRRYRIGDSLSVSVGQAGKRHQVALWRLLGECGGIGGSVPPSRTRVGQEKYIGAEHTPRYPHTPTSPARKDDLSAPPLPSSSVSGPTASSWRRPAIDSASVDDLGPRVPCSIEVPGAPGSEPHAVADAEVEL